MKTTSVSGKRHLAGRILGPVLAVMMVLTQCVIPMSISAAAGDAVSIGTDASSRIFFAESSKIPEGFDIAEAYDADKLFTVDSLVDGHKAMSALNLVMEDGKDLTFTTTINVETAGTYLIKTIGSLTTAEALEAVNETGYSLKNEWLTSCTVDVDDTVLDTNAAFGTIGSTGSHFVEKITNGYHQTFTDYTSVLTSQVVELTAGTHTITHKMGERQGSKSYAFVLDFMDIVPVGTVDSEQTTVIPAYYFRPTRMNTLGVVTDGNQNAVVTANYTLVVPDYTLTTDLGGGKKIEEKLTAVHEYNTKTNHSVTLNVENEGLYNISYLVSPSSGWQSGAKAWLDQAAEEVCQIQSLPCKTLDYGWDASGVSSAYNHNQFQPNRYTQQVFLTKGAHVLNLEFETLSSEMCVYTFDRIEIAPATVPTLEDNVKIEAEYFGDWTLDDNAQMTAASNDSLSGKAAKEMKTYTNEEGETVTYTMYVMSEKAEKYKLEIGAAAYNTVNGVSWLSKVEMLVNDESLGNLGEGRAKQTSNTTYVVNGDHWYHTYAIANPIGLNKGLNKIQFKASGRTDGGFIFGLDYISGTSVTPSISATETTRVFFEESAEYPSGFEVATAYDPTKLYTTESLISGHKAMNAKNLATETGDIVFETDVYVETAGTYLIKTIGSVAAADSAKHATWLTACTVQVDEKELDTNPVFSEELVTPVTNSYDSAFANHTSVLTSQLVELTAGTHTIKHIMGKEHAYAFALDFMDIVPIGIVEADVTTVIPAYYLNPANGLGDAMVIPEQTLITDLGGDNKIEEKLTAVHLSGDGGMVDYSVAIDVKDEGMYNISYLVSSNEANWKSTANVWIDEDTESVCEVQSFPRVALDYQWTGSGTGYVYSDFQPNRYTQQAYLTEGRHTINLQVENMVNGYPIFTFDRIEISLASVPTLKDGAKIEAEYFGSWSDDDNAKMSDAPNSNLSGGVAKEIVTFGNAEDQTVIYTMYVMSEQAKSYEMMISAAASNSVSGVNWLNMVEMFVNGESLGYLGEANGTLGGKVQLLAPGEYITNNTHYWYHNYTTTEAISMKAGLNKIQFKAVGPAASGVGFGLDCISVWETREFSDSVWTLEFTSDTIVKGKTACAVVKNGSTIVTPDDVYSMTFKAEGTQEIAAVSVDGEGTVTGLEPGEAKITVEIRVNPSDTTTITREAYVYVVDGGIYISETAFSTGELTFKVNNSTETAHTDAIVIVAGYDEYGRMLGVDTQIKTLTANGYADCSTANETIILAPSIKIMVVNSWTALKPLLESAKEL